VRDWNVRDDAWAQNAHRSEPSRFSARFEHLIGDLARQPEFKELVGVEAGSVGV
jgi:hypothetical protein